MDSVHLSGTEDVVRAAARIGEAAYQMEQASHRMAEAGFQINDAIGRLEDLLMEWKELSEKEES